MRVRRIQNEEGSLVQALRLAALSDSPKAFGGTYEQAIALSGEEYEIVARSRASSETDAIFIAIELEEPVGMIGAFFDISTSQPFISSMWVAPHFRRAGVGRQLFQTAQNWLRDRGAQKVNAWVVTNNSPAISFYESLGFVASEQVAPLPSDNSLVEQLYVQSSTAV
jgi:GNAT superfamily N-acetyltransferase